MKYYIKRLIIKLFGLHDIENIILKACLKQKTKDDADKKEALHNLEVIKDRIIDYNQQVSNAEIAMLEIKNAELQNHDRHVSEREYICKVQIANNTAVTARLLNKYQVMLNFINREQGEFESISADIMKAFNSMKVFDNKHKVSKIQEADSTKILEDMKEED